MVRPIVVGLPALLLPRLASAQEFTGGLVRDSAGRPLPSVVVSIRGATDSTLARATTERDGTFLMTVPGPGRYRLRFDVALDVVVLSDTIAIEKDGFVERQFRVPVPADAVYFDFQVAKPVVMRPGTFKVLQATDPRFGAAVGEAVPTMRFLSAERDGRKVAQLVQQPFEFEVRR